MSRIFSLGLVSFSNGTPTENKSGVLALGDSQIVEGQDQGRIHMNRTLLETENMGLLGDGVLRPFGKGFSFRSRLPTDPREVRFYIFLLGYVSVFSIS